MSVCNIFSEIQETDRSKLFVFSEYTNDLAEVVANNGYADIKPSKFICLNLDPDIIESGELVPFLQYNYENLQCAERDSKKTDYSYKNYLLGGLLDGLVESGLKEDALTELCIGDIDVIGNSVIDGMKYNDIICYLQPNDNCNKKAILGSGGITFAGTDYLKGYEGDADYEVPVEYRSGRIFKPISDFEEYEGGYDQFSFNTIIVLYDYGTQYKNIPLALYYTKDTVTKYVSNPEIYYQGTSYALRISMRFACTSDSTGNLNTAVTTDIVPVYAECMHILDRLNLTIDKMNILTAKINDYINAETNIINANIAANLPINS